MQTLETFAQFVTRLPAGSEPRLVEILRRHLNDQLRDLPTLSVVALRARCLEWREQSGDPAMIVEMVDGLLALRELSKT